MYKSYFLSSSNYYDLIQLAKYFIQSYCIDFIKYKIYYLRFIHLFLENSEYTLISVLYFR